MKLCDFEVGHGIIYTKMNEHRDLIPFYGLVVGVSDKDISFVVVLNIIRRLPNGNDIYKVLCYDDADAVYEKHKDNVRLRGCPPPFSLLTKGKKENVYAQAGKIEHFTEEELIKYRVDILDDGAKVSDDVIKEILCHPFPMQPQKEFTYHKDLHDNISLKSDEGHNMQFGG